MPLTITPYLKESVWGKLVQIQRCPATVTPFGEVRLPTFLKWLLLPSWKEVASVNGFSFAPFCPPLCGLFAFLAKVTFFVAARSFCDE